MGRSRNSHLKKRNLAASLSKRSMRNQFRAHRQSPRVEGSIPTALLLIFGSQRVRFGVCHEFDG